MKDKDSSSNVTIAMFGGTRRIDDQAAAWVLENRKISRATLERLNVACGTEYFGEVGQKLPCIKFLYEDGGWKARSMSPTKAFTSQLGMEVTFWGLRDVLNGPMQRVYIVEGEFDRCALVEAGIGPNCILAAPGATKGTESPEYVREALNAGLSKCKKFVLCMDQDEAGLLFRAVLARVLGIARVEFIDWDRERYGKDANDFLIAEGRDGLLELLQTGSKPWPSEGLFKMREVTNSTIAEVWYPWKDLWGKRIALAPSMLSIVTGQPNHGKTQLWAQLFFQMMVAHDLVACIATFETRPKPHYQKIIRQLYAQKPLYDSDGRLVMDVDDMKRADEWIESHYLFIIHNEQRPTLEWMLQQAEVAVVRYGARILQIDPWNRLEAQKEQRENDTDYVGRCLRALHTFANDFKVHVQVLAHPSKMEGYRRGSMPELEDIAASKHWENMADQGFVVHRPKLYDDDGVPQSYAELHYKKSRFEQLGVPSKFGLDYDRDQGRFGVCPLAKKQTKGANTAVKDAREQKESDYDEPDRLK